MDLSIRHDDFEEAEKINNVSFFTVKCKHSQFIIFYDEESDGLSVRVLVSGSIIVKPFSLGAVTIAQEKR